MIQQLALLASIVKTHLAPYIALIFETITPFWEEHQTHILSLMEVISLSTGDDFAPFIPPLIKLLLSSLAVPKFEAIGLVQGRRQSSSSDAVRAGAVQVGSSQIFRQLERSLSCADAMRHLLRPSLILVVPVLCKLVEKLQVKYTCIRFFLLTVRWFDISFHWILLLRSTVWMVCLGKYVHYGPCTV